MFRNILVFLLFLPFIAFAEIQSASFFQRYQILEAITKYAGTGFRFIGNSLKYYAQYDNGQGSSYYRNRIIEAINLDSLIKIDMSPIMPNPQYKLLKILDKSFKSNSNIPKRIPTTNSYLMGTVRITTGNTIGKSLISYDGTPLVYDEGQKMIHELLSHAIPKLTRNPAPLSSSVIEENIARIQLGLPQRDVTKYLETIGSIGEW